MAKRYSGELTIELTYQDPLPGETTNGSYECTLSGPANSPYHVTVGTPAILVWAVDCTAAFDDAAHAAISFMMDEIERVGWVPPGVPESLQDGLGWQIDLRKEGVS